MGEHRIKRTPSIVALSAHPLLGFHDVQLVLLDVEAGVGHAPAPHIMFPLPQTDNEVPFHRQYCKAANAGALDHHFGP